MNRWQFWIDVGGTFTDCVAQTPDGGLVEWKTLSSGAVKGRVDELVSGKALLDPLRAGVAENFWSGWTLTLRATGNEKSWSSRVVASQEDGRLTLSDGLPADALGAAYELRCDEDAPLICVRRLLNLRLDEPLPDVDIRMGTTRGTNALLERKGAATALLITKGFADLLLIGNQDRPDLFALNIRKFKPLTSLVVEVDERLGADGSVLQALDAEAARRELQSLKKKGIESIAICLLHAYRNPAHELLLEELATEAGFSHVSRSSQVAPVIKIVPRAETTVLDAYLNPVLRSYVDRIRARLGSKSTLKLMGSQGGLVAGEEFSGKDSILSGPAGGVIAYAEIAQQAGFGKAIGFDMGGTSTDVSRFDGRYDLESETVKAGLRIATPVLAIETVAAGGGSVCAFDGVQLKVGPESAGADPGPACYGRGGPLTITDANLWLGRVLPEHFPFPLDQAAVGERLEAIRQSLPDAAYSVEQLAQGFVDIANETMARAVRAISVRKGYDPAAHLLVCFGGAGGQHACALARMLGMKSILIHPYAGLLSAYGMGLADVRRRAEQSVLQPYSPETISSLATDFDALTARLTAEVQAEGISASEIAKPTRSLGLRYRGVEATILVTEPVDGDYRRAYEQRHKQLYGYVQAERPLEIVSLAVEVVGRLPRARPPQLAAATAPLQPRSQRQAWFNGQPVQAGVYFREDLRGGHELSGPAIICDTGSTIWVEPGFHVEVRETGELLLTRREAIEAGESYTDIELNDNSAPHPRPLSPEYRGEGSLASSEVADPVTLEIFNNQFASIAEQMGVTLRKTSISTNVKERLDYSCALFDGEGGLVVNAPHIPVHLGAMGETVRCVLRDNPQLAPGDVILTNDPYAGGSHLPDLTVVTPVHDQQTGELLFLTASRAHHAEIGGITPGSMPPFSRTLGDEGVLIRNFKIVDQGESKMEAFRDLLSSGPWPSRNPDDNLADVSAQVAANRLGADLLLDLVRQSSRVRVQQYMRFIQQAAETKMRRALQALPDGRYERTDFLDDGSPIAVAITIENDTAVIDFTETGPVLATNLNANRAIVTAAVMYVFRCLIEDSIPLNSGVLKPLTIVLPECLLNPPASEERSACAAMVGGNVETSQRVVDVLLGALGVAAASQGTMNNLTFGDKKFGYYETICGGAGATLSTAGADAVHTHMTNTRLTDAEVFETRYPVRIEEFSIRRGSGGQGHHRGGDGIRRVFLFEKPLSVSLLTQRRGPYAPFGLEGGEPGALGRNLLLRNGALDVEQLPGAAQLQVEPGDRLIIETPGGGGFGAADSGLLS
ncbi:hydantoinase B/oxoprolinase family protein [Planctomicrobium piriforme]|uniref:5-oxoprolinase (ATP-hydrolysing) n=1 Tax=Planctomicrobium piriforme TaxID=1576369 RepID=A0A1I3T1L5_9PLAN|nr:hydantoinase B/oxoprolinase family protein [Planctomicrobium piriforme]SFJ64825.1 5-oxoprolinase (ATP-hydrolysing) [Planctomicrobium piriforme]